MQGKLCIFLFLINKLYAQAIFPSSSQNYSVVLPIQTNWNHVNATLPVVPNLSLIISNASLYTLLNEYYNSVSYTPEDDEPNFFDESDSQNSWANNPQNSWENDPQTGWENDYNSNATDFGYDENDDYDENDEYDEDDEDDIFRKKKKKCRKCQCGLRFERKIIHGVPTVKYEFPWIVVLTFLGRFYCGGSLINNKYVATAGHCALGFPKDTIGIRFREYARDQPFETHTFRRAVKKVIIHPGFNLQTLHNDIALMKLMKPVIIGGKILRPICLPIRGHSYAKQRGVVAGWGVTASGFVAKILRKVAVKIFPNGRCRRTDYGNSITSSMICAGFIVGGKDSCSGDSGGPLMARDEGRLRMVGIVSFGFGCAQPNAPGVYTRVTKFVGWIRQNTKDACYCKD